jgi:hypothetical protein
MDLGEFDLDSALDMARLIVRIGEIVERGQYWETHRFQVGGRTLELSVRTEPADEDEPSRSGG